MIDASKPYKAKNMIATKVETDVAKKTGFLELKIFSEEDHEPISDANITIYLYEVRGLYNESAIENVITSHVSDINGKIPVIELPVIHELGNPEENTDEYHLKVEASGYYTVIVVNIEIFPETTTSFNVVLSPVATGEDYTQFIIIPEKH